MSSSNDTSIRSDSLDDIRSEWSHLGKQITRLSIVLIASLIIITVTISNALDQVDLTDLKRDLESKESAQRIASDLYFDEPEEKQSEEAEKRREVLRNAWHKALDEARATRKKYDAQLKESFSVSPSFLGAKTSLDLRSWVYCIPFALLIAFVYIQILRKKQHVLYISASPLVCEAIASSAVNRLTFSETHKQTAYAKNPGQLEHAVYLFITVFLISVLVSDLSDADVVFLGLGPLETVQYLVMLLTVAFYGWVYYRSVARSLDRQIPYRAKPTASSRSFPAWNSVRAFVAKQLRYLRQLHYLKARPSLLTASLLILASLFLSTAASCDPANDFKPAPGYKLLKEPGGPTKKLEHDLEHLENLLSLPATEDVEETKWRDPGGGWWVSALITTKHWGLYWQNAIHNLGRTAYIFALVIASLSLLLVVVQNRLVGLVRARLALCLSSATLAFIIIIDFAFSLFWLKDELFLISNLFWIVPTFLLWQFVAGKRPAKRERIGRFLLALFSPLMISATVFAIYLSSQGYYGVLVYFLGINLLALTYLNIVTTNLTANGSHTAVQSIVEPETG